MAKKKKKKSKKDEEPKLATRFQKDLDEVSGAKLSGSFRDFHIYSEKPLIYTALILPQDPPYNDGAFRIKIIFPIEYPFRPPKIIFVTKIYHPNIDAQGRISMPIIWSEHWKPTTTFLQIIQTLIALICTPVLENAIVMSIARQYRYEREKFMKAAMEFTTYHAEQRP